MDNKCPWCGKDAARGQGYHDLPETPHGFCEDCYIRIRLTETVSKLQAGSGPFHVFLPPGREDIAARIQQEAPAGSNIIVHYDRRTEERRRPGSTVASERRDAKERRILDLSFVAPRPPRE